MPIYEYRCEDHGVYEIFMASYSQRTETITCPLLTKTGERCNKLAEVQISRVSMQPDTFWNGKKTVAGYFTSADKYKEHLKRTNSVECSYEELPQLEREAEENKRFLEKKEEDRFDESIGEVIREHHWPEGWS